MWNTPSRIGNGRRNRYTLPMRIAVVYGQTHHGNTWKLTQELLSRLNCGAEDIQEFQLGGVRPCVGCCQCILKDEKLCPNRAFVEPVIHALEQCDVIILSSPNYCFGMTGQMKEFCDHMAYRWISHRPVDMHRKIGVAISTAAGGGAENVTKELSRQLLWWSVGSIHSIAFSVRADNWDAVKPSRKKKVERKVARLAERINKTSTHAGWNLKGRALFLFMKAYIKRSGWNPLDRQWWIEQYGNGV